MSLLKTPTDCNSFVQLQEQADHLSSARLGQHAVPRSGAVLLVVMVCLLVVMLLAAATAQNLVLHQRQTRVEQHRLQALWLAESALDRTAALLQMDPDYAGTKWRIEVPGLAGTQSGVAEIRVELDDSSPRRRKIQIVARWPDDPVYRYVYHKDLVVNLAVPGDSQ